MLVRPQLSYPGVYVQEIPSGSRAIVGVSTSITAFLGRTPRGPVNEPVTLNSENDFSRHFGGLTLDYPLSYAIRDFFQSGGSQAIVVRLFNDGDEGTEAAPTAYVARVSMRATAPWATGSAAFCSETDDTLFELSAANPGSWGNQLRAWVDYEGIGAASPEGSFNLHVALVDEHGADVETETFTNVTLETDGARFLGAVLESSSVLVALARGGPRPPAGAGGEVTTAVADSGPLKTEHYVTGEAGRGLYALDHADLINLICVPPDTRGGDTHPAVYAAATVYAEKRRALVIIDGPAQWDLAAKEGRTTAIQPTDLGIDGELGRNAAVYFPRVLRADPLDGDKTHVFPTSGAIAGIYARTDATRGVWKAPAGLEAGLSGIEGLNYKLTDAENGQLNPLGINCLRTFPVTGTVVWGARTLRGADQLADEYKYVPVRRLALYIAESLSRGTRWAVFEPNDEPLWAQLRLTIGGFMNDLFRQGAFQGGSADEAYFVKCDSSTTTQADIDADVVNVVVGFAPLKPAEFNVIYIQQKAGAAQ